MEEWTMNGNAWNFTLSLTSDVKNIFFKPPNIHIVLLTKVKIKNNRKNALYDQWDICNISEKRAHVWYLRNGYNVTNADTGFIWSTALKNVWSGKEIDCYASTARVISCAIFWIINTN
jgi:hypothetical protein